MPDVSEPISFSHLVRECELIEVPLIQRDYAQGRESQKDVRTDFLGSLFDALKLPAGDAKLPLNLDFVYGSLDSVDGADRFLPLDGQQRLTTLFLLHWYLAWRDEGLEAFQQLLWDGKRSRFTYGVRPSSTEFFDALVKFVPGESPDLVGSVRRMLEDEPWFFLHWRLDPTIQSALTMLDAIHEKFKGSRGLWNRLADERQPVITFHLLPLEHFGLSDDLYIKMNARGKPLTAFETFKARFEELLKELFPTGTRKVEDGELAVPAFFELRMDTRWTDFFWTHQHSTFDDAVLNLMWAVVRISLEPTSPSFGTDTASLGDRSLRAGFTTFHDRKWLTTRFADHLMDVLEAWSGGEGGRMQRQLPDGKYFDEELFFRRAILSPSGLSYLDLVQFAGFAFYLTEHRGALRKEHLHNWIRIVTNLATNSDIERPEEFARSLTGLRQLLPHADNILERFAGKPDIDILGFSSQQAREEALKAKLILSRAGWGDRIEAAESHGYFRGQIEFLLKFCGVFDRWLSDPSCSWSESEDVVYQRNFDEYMAKSFAVFSNRGLNDFGAYRWERALLVKGDYLLQRGLNRSFLDNSERDASWKRLLRGSYRSDSSTETKRRYVRELLDEIDLQKGVKESLDEVLQKAGPVEEWRQAMIETPRILGYCEARKIRWHSDGNIYLMRRIQMNGEHAELHTYRLYVGLMSKKLQQGELFPFTLGYEAVSGEAALPSAFLQWIRGDDDIVVRLCHLKDAFLITARNREGPLPIDLNAELKAKAHFTELKDGHIYRVVGRPLIETAINEVVDAARRVGASDA